MSLRNYSYKDVVMLMAAKTILQSMQANLGELGAARTNWTGAYVTGLIQKINTAIEDFLGLDKKQDLREATGLLNLIRTPALRDLALVKTQIEVDFTKDVGEILKILGLTKDLHDISQEDLIEVLYSFKKGMTDGLKTTITEKGTNPALIDAVIGYADQLQQANLTQEGQKASGKEVSQEAVGTFNEIYKEVIGIGKIASKIYKDNPVKKDQFTFSKVVKKMGSADKKEVKPAAQ